MIFIFIGICILGVIMSIIWLFLIAKEEVVDSSKYSRKKYNSDYNHCFLLLFMFVIGLIGAFKSL